MLIPSIDLQDGRVVQLVQGERLALASDDLDGWIDRFSPFPMVQVIDLDAAMGRGDNSALVGRIAARLTCQVGGGVRMPDRAQELLDAGATRVIVGSALFDTDGLALDRARAFAEGLGSETLVAAVDSRGGRIAIDGWRTTLALSAAEAVRGLTPFAGAFLFTQIDTEGTMAGIDTPAIQTVQTATSRRIIAAGGIRSLEDVDALDVLGIDAVVGMAVYTGAIDLEAAARRWGRPGNTPPDPPV
jgi:phosphoribosylformimino-5-aminoimidazole carboxamide ribotide isomerase